VPLHGGRDGAGGPGADHQPRPAAVRWGAGRAGGADRAGEAGGADVFPGGGGGGGGAVRRGAEPGAAAGDAGGAAGRGGAGERPAVVGAAGGGSHDQRPADRGGDRAGVRGRDGRGGAVSGPGTRERPGPGPDGSADPREGRSGSGQGLTWAADGGGRAPREGWVRRYLALMRVGWLVDLQYRAAIVIWLVLGAAQPLVSLAIWWVVAGGGEVGGFGRAAFA